MRSDYGLHDDRAAAELACMTKNSIGGERRASNPPCRIDRLELEATSWLAFLSESTAC